MAPAAVMPIVKANAYGHGLVPVARHLASLGARSLGVAFLEEAVALREAGLTLPILVMGGIFGDQIPIFLRHALTLVRLAEETAKPSAERLSEFSEGNLKATRAQLLSPRPVQKPIDATLLAAGLREAQDELGAEHPFVKTVLGGQTPEALAQAGHRVVLVDCDLRKRTLAGRDRKAGGKNCLRP